MPLMNVERELLQEMRDCIEANVPKVFHHTGDFPVLAYEATIHGAFYHVSKKYRGVPKQSLAIGRLSSKFAAAGGLFDVDDPRTYGYRYFNEDRSNYPLVKILPGNISEDTYYSWKILIGIAWLDRILETGEIK